MVHTIRQRQEAKRSRRLLSNREAQVMAVTKGRSPEEIREAYKAGIRVFGENRVQEALSKIDCFRALKNIQLHMIGHLQTNKAKEAVSFFDVIESVDSMHLLAKIHDEARKQNKPMRIFIQVNISRDPKKFGVMPDRLFELLRNAHGYTSTGFLIIDGLMTMVEHTKDPEARRPFFRKMKELFDELRSLFSEGHIEHAPLRYLSMGMSEDFDIALEEGANLIRLGRIIFERPGSLR